MRGKDRETHFKGRDHLVSMNSTLKEVLARGVLVIRIQDNFMKSIIRNATKCNPS